MNPRTCIVTREAGDAESLIRFVADPQGRVVPDLKRRLPGRGVWVGARRALVEEAVRKRLFSRGLKQEAEASQALAAEVDRLIEEAALGALSMARKAGAVVTGFTKVEAAIRSRKAALVLNAADAAADGRRKLEQAIHATHGADAGPPVKAVFSSLQMGLALGTDNVVHAAATEGGAGENLIRRIEQLERYRA